MLKVSCNIVRDSFTLNVEHSFSASGITTVFGPSGCGKTTLLRTIAGLDKHQASYVSLDATTWQDSSCFVPAHQRQLGYVSQNPNLFPHLSVLANLEYGFKRQKAVCGKGYLAEAIELLDLQALLNRKPNSLSGGEQQRVAIGRAIACHPKLLMLDEPLAALDRVRKQALLPYFQRIQRQLNIPLIYVSHSTDEVAQIADHLVLMDNGRIVGDGPISQMLTRLDMPLSQLADAESVFEAKLESHDSAYHLTTLSFSGGKLLVPALAVDAGQCLRVRIAARDVSLALDNQSNSSILNVFRATVMEINKPGNGQAMLVLDLGGQPLLARITEKSCDELNIVQGKSVFAQAKSVAVLA